MTRLHTCQKGGVPIGVPNAALKRNPIVQNGFVKHVKLDCAWQKTRTVSMNFTGSRFKKKVLKSQRFQYETTKIL
jgi:hypothetical protein